MIRQIFFVALFLCPLALADSPAEDAKYKDLVSRLESARGADLEKLKAELIQAGMPAHRALQSGSASTEKLRSEIRRAIRARRDADALAAGLVLHEWGVLTSTQGVDRFTLGVPGDAGDLPEFVQQWNKIQTPRDEEHPAPGIRLDPVLYFYSKTPETVSLTLACPRGIFTSWSPKATRVQPAPGSINLKTESPSGGTLLWKNFDLVPAGAGNLPSVPEKAWWWPIARQTDSAVVKMNDQSEKFLYYGGILDDAPLPLQFEGGAGQKYTLRNQSWSPVQHVLVLNVTQAQAAFQHIAQIAPNSSLSVSAALGKDAKPTSMVSAQARDLLAELLESEGLFPKESAGIAQIAQRQWFARPGVRILYINPPEATASLLPIRCDPPPARRTRILLVVHECLADSLDNVVEQLIRQLGDDNFARREAATTRLTELGPKALPALTRAMKKTDDTEIRNRLQAILRKIDPKSKALEDLSKPEQPQEPEQ